MNFRSRLKHQLTILDVRDAAAELQITTTALKQLVNRNLLKSYRLGESGQLLRLLRCDLEEFSSQHPRLHGLLRLWNRVMELEI